MKTNTGKRIVFLVQMLLLCMMLLGIQSVYVSAEADTPVQVKMSGKYYWKDASGEIIRKSGWYEVGSKTYYLGKTGACYTGIKKIDKKLYYFSSKGELRKKTGWYKGTNYTYYHKKDYSLATGRKKIGTKYYLFSTSTGRLLKNKTAVKIGTVYYKTNSSGVATQMTTPQVKCHNAAKAFISKHSSSSQSKSARFRACYNYLLAYMKYSPGYYSVSGDYAKIAKKDFQYNLALETFTSSVLRGNCHRFACCIAAIASELGYNPYVVVTTGDHSFVMINNLYYDNMGALFGASSHSPYTVYKKVKM